MNFLEEAAGAGQGNGEVADHHDERDDVQAIGPVQVVRGVDRRLVAVGAGEPG